ncbi:Positive regulator of sigma E activity [Fusobacterium necrogenes]|uniref:Positive regulator of sigma E activity n=1 Tax=Fusobacterium necrogenes TaxID=858 RepID=A0A377GVC9_9FUSO|nr:SoxR reducing system RseC family protein [Fusobacterium necrogenes]STO30947.1 Positive regulator of sigma E activity [Fusobacterium necrogenes]
MLNKGVIKKIDGNKIIVKLYKDTSCSHCSGCSGDSKYGKDFEFTTDMKANIGDTVTFEISTGKVIKAASIAYVFPAITMIAGYFLGEKLLGLSENQSIIASFLALVVSFIVLYLYDKFIVKKQTNSEIEIISIEKEDTSTILNSCENKNIW